MPLRSFANYKLIMNRHSKELCGAPTNERSWAMAYLTYAYDRHWTWGCRGCWRTLKSFDCSTFGQNLKNFGQKCFDILQKH